MNWEVKEYISKTISRPDYSEPKWFAINSTTTTLDFSAAKYILLSTLITPIIDGGTLGTSFTFSANGIVLIRWGVGIGLQSDVKIIPLDFLILTQRVLLTSSITGFSIRIITIGER